MDFDPFDGVSDEERDETLKNIELMKLVRDNIGSKNKEEKPEDDIPFLSKILATIIIIGICIACFAAFPIITSIVLILGIIGCICNKD
jgi:small-conductance mechanosensitive channel